MKRGIEITCLVGMVIMACGLALAQNSLVGPDDIRKMKKANISDGVIQTLLTEQTCSITGEYLVMLKRAGANDEMLKIIILADRYKNPRKADLTVEEMELLRKAGFSDEVIVQLSNMTPSKRVTDAQGNESVVYGTGLPIKPETDTPQQEQPTFNINIEKVEQP